MYVQTPVLGERRNELRWQESIFAVDSIQGVQLAVARNDEDGHLSESARIFGDGWRIVETARTQPMRLLLGLALHRKFFLPEHLARVRVCGVGSERRGQKQDSGIFRFHVVKL